MKELFEIAAGSVVGKDHFLVGKNNQDAYCCVISDNAIVAVVCDGCGSEKHSEVGAKIGAKLTVNSVLRAIKKFPDDSIISMGKYKERFLDLFFERIKNDILDKIRILAGFMGGDSFLQTLIDYFLFTIVGTIITPKSSVVFALGDGVVIVNDEILKIEPFFENRPPYLVYNAIKPEKLNYPISSEFKILRFAPTKEINSILIGTDGVTDLINSSRENLPGKNIPVGPISQFWGDDCYFKNHDMVRRKLAIMNKSSMKINWGRSEIEKESGILSDDTTIIVVRRKKGGG